jgi:transcriptional regulator MraZ
VDESGEHEEGGDRAGETRFWGTHEHSLDAKGRVILPARFREPFRGGAFITKLPEGCLGVWTPQEFERRTVAMLEKGRQGQAERNVARVWAAGAFDTSPDGQGRLAIPASLRSYAQLDGDVVVNGAINHVELWNARKWSEIDAEGSQFLLSGTDALDDIGF